MELELYVLYVVFCRIYKKTSWPGEICIAIFCRDFFLSCRKTGISSYTRLRFPLVVYSCWLRKYKTFGFLLIFFYTNLVLIITNIKRIILFAAVDLKLCSSIHFEDWFFIHIDWYWYRLLYVYAINLNYLHLSTFETFHHLFYELTSITRLLNWVS